MDSKYIYRSFVVYSIKRNELIFVVRRGCGKSFNDTIKEVVKKCKEAQINPDKQNIYHQGRNCEWHGIIVRDTQIYFLLMTVSGMNQKQVLDDALTLSKMIRKIPQYDLQPKKDLQEKRTEDVLFTMKNMDKYLAADAIGMYSDEDVKEVSIGNTIVLNSDFQFSSRQNVLQSEIVKKETNINDYNPPELPQFNSNNNNNNNNNNKQQQQQQPQQQQQQQQQQQASQIDNSSQFMKQFNPPNSGIIQSSGNLQQKKNTVYRCFAIYSLKERDLIFILRRGCKKSYQGTVEKLKKELGSSGNTLKFYMQGTNQTEWHGILDEKQKCYFLMMTFSGSQQALVMKTLNEIKGLHSTQQIENLGQSVIYQKMMEETMRTVDKFELEYILANGGEGVGIPSDDEGAFSQSQGLNPPIISGTITNLNPFIGLPELTHNQMLQQLKNFKPATQESDKIVLVSSLVLIVVFMIGLVSIYI